MAEANGFDVWLKRTAWALLVVLLVISCVFMRRMVNVATQLDKTLAALSGDMKQVASTAATISKQVDGVIERLDRLEEKTKDALRLDDLEVVLDEVASLRGAVEGNVGENPTAQAEIKHLLSYIRSSGLRFEYSGKDRSAARLYLKLYAKYKFYKKTLTSTEDFIQRVATKTVAGNLYYVVLKDGTKEELAAWLGDALAAYRNRKPAGTE